MNQDIEKIISDALESVDVRSRNSFERRQVAAYCEERLIDSSSASLVWVFAEIAEENVCFGFCENGYDKQNLKWGLMFINSRTLGDSGAWYNELSELIDDCGYF